jgi:hypothetical protein
MSKSQALAVIIIMRHLPNLWTDEMMGRDTLKL